MVRECSPLDGSEHTMKDRDVVRQYYCFQRLVQLWLLCWEQSDCTYLFSGAKCYSWEQEDTHGQSVEDGLLLWEFAWLQTCSAAGILWGILWQELVYRVPWCRVRQLCFCSESCNHYLLVTYTIECQGMLLYLRLWRWYRDSVTSSIVKI